MEQLTLLNILDKLEKKTVYFGPQGFDLVATAGELKTAQQGYGTDLSGAENGDWKKSWLVFARDTELGDPYFVDISADELPVYTAIRGEASWETELVSSSLKGFIKCMRLLSESGHQKCAQFVPDEKTMIDSNQLNQLSADLIAASACQNFWQVFFECYADWLADDDSEPAF